MNRLSLLLISFLIITGYIFSQEMPVEYRSGSYIIDRSPVEEYAGRRDKLMELTGDGVILLVGRGDDRGYGDVGTFRQDLNFFYFTGVEIPNSVLFMFTNKKREILYLPERNLPLERWTGPKLGPDDDDAVKFTGITDLRPTYGGEIIIDARRRPVRSWKEELILHAELGLTVHLIIRGNKSYEHQLAEELRRKVPHVTISNIYPVVTEIRRKKSDEEIRLMQKAVDITLDAHRELAKAIKPGRYEFEVQAIAEYIMRKNGAEGMAFPSIVGSGFNATVLHYDQNIRKMMEGDLVVVDIGALYGFYCADITRTYPVNGVFTERQRELYEVVLGAQEAVLDKLRPGLSIFDLRKIAYEYINNYGKDSNGDRLGEYFIHGVSHFVGLEVHDVGSEHSPLRPGDVITVEPGVYIPDEIIGIRIEDMFLITEEGYIHISGALPRQPEEIELLMRGN